VTSRLDQIVARVLDIPVAEVSGQLGPKVSAQWTSLRHVQLIAAVEDAYGVGFTPREIRSVRDVSGLRDLIVRKAGRE